MGPGIPNPMLWGGADPIDEYGVIARSLRFRSSATAYMYRTFGAPTTQNVFTYSGWCKRSNFGAVGVLFGYSTTSGFNFNATDVLRAGSPNGDVMTSAVYRDPAAWMHVMYVQSGTSVTLYVNGLIAASGTLTSAQFNTAANHFIGAYSTPSNPFSGYLAHVAFVDGKALTPDIFARSHHRTGQWRPKRAADIRASISAGGGVRNGWGNNGFFLTFEDNSSLAALCYDKSQSDSDTTGNNWTPVNFSLTSGNTYDSVLDSPTKNYCTFSPITQTIGTISNGGLTVSGASGPFAQGSISMSRGRWRAEFKYAAIGTAAVFVLLRSVSGSGNAVGYGSNGNKAVNGVYSAYGSTFVANVTIGVIADIDNNTLEFFRNGVSQGVISYPLSGQRWVFSNGVFGTNGSDTLHVNFGQQSYDYPASLASAKDLCAKNLPFPSIPRPSDAFVVKTSMGANIKAVLEAASPWTQWIRAYKRLDAAEGWRWEFSDDPGYYMDTSGAAAKAAFPALPGSSYVGRAFKVSPGNGISTGRVNHTNTVATVVNDGLSNARKLVILVNEAGSNWFTYHPELTSGKLVYLNLWNAETTDDSIGTVSSSGFTVAAALPTGTYRWIAIAEIEGFSRLGKHINNGSSDGIHIFQGLTPRHELLKEASTTSSWYDYDTVRGPENPLTSIIETMYTNAQTTAAALSIDAVSNGVKIRGTNPDLNTNTVTAISIEFAEFPFRYANAR